MSILSIFLLIFIFVAIVLIVLNVPISQRAINIILLIIAALEILDSHNWAITLK